MSLTLNTQPLERGAAVAADLVDVRAEARDGDVVVELAGDRRLLERVLCARRVTVASVGAKSVCVLPSTRTLTVAASADAGSTKHDERQENEALGHESSFREGLGMEGDRQVF